MVIKRRHTISLHRIFEVFSTPSPLKGEGRDEGESINSFHTPHLNPLPHRERKARLFSSASNCGVTLVELMMVIAILGIMSTVGSTIFIKINEFYYLNRARVEVQRDGRIALSLINRTLRQGQSATIVIDQATGHPPYSRITFTKNQGQTISFYQQNTRLFMQTGSAARQISDGLRYIAFTFPMSDDMGIVSVSLTMEKETFQGRSKAMHLAVEKIRVMN